MEQRNGHAQKPSWTGDGLPLPDDDPELACLGGCLRHNAAIGDVMQLITADDFRGVRSLAFQCIVDLYGSGRPVDTVTLAGLLKERGQLADVGGPGWLWKLWDGAPTGHNAEHHAQIVRDRSILRQLTVAGGKVSDYGLNPHGPADEMLEQAERDVFAIAERSLANTSQPVSEAVDQAWDRIDSRQTGDGSGSALPTGWIDLDRQTAGLQPSELVLVGARPSTGKTAFGLGLAAHAAAHGHPVLFVSLEQSRAELAERLICSEGSVDSFKLRSGNLSEADLERSRDASTAIRAWPLVIDDHPYQTAVRIGANARRLRLRRKIRLVVIDYLQLITPENRKENRQEQVAGISRRLKGLARELGIPVVTLAQLNRAPEDRHDRRPRLADLRESGALEMDADAVFLLHKPDGQEGVVDVLVAKNRNGPTGEISLAFVREYMRFENFALPVVPFAGGI
jgi:replicative DNA helicase